jgi:hypothetical protein
LCDENTEKYGKVIKAKKETNEVEERLKNLENEEAEQLDLEDSGLMTESIETKTNRRKQIGEAKAENLVKKANLSKLTDEFLTREKQIKEQVLDLQRELKVLEKQRTEHRLTRAQLIKEMSSLQKDINAVKNEMHNIQKDFNRNASINLKTG